MPEADWEFLEKHYQKDPQNPLLENQYESALLRRQQNEKVKAHFRFKWLCPQKWEELSLLPTPPHPSSKKL